MTEKTLTFTTQEIQVIIQLLDLAVKAGGLQVAEPAVVLQKRFQTVMPSLADEIQIIREDAPSEK